MSDPYRVDGPAVISFSGGRTSGVMLYRIIEAHGGTLPADVVPVFCNTGKEHEATLDFVRDCAERWSVPIRWLEYLDHDEPQRRWREVDYESASRDGEPFAAVIGRKKYLPNPVTRFCTTDMKVRPAKLFAQQELGFDYWTVALGLRADEPGRVARLSTDNREPFDRIAPLSAAGVTKADVRAFWLEQSFDLGLPLLPDGTTPAGNCDLCFLKGAGKIASIVAAEPERAVWWAAQERRIGGTFRNDRPAYAQILAQGSLMFDQEDLIECACTD